MKASPLLLPSQQPVWLRLVLTVAAALISTVCTSHQYPFTTMLAWFFAYFILIGMSWLIIRQLPEEHPIRLLEAEHTKRCKRFRWSYGSREYFWMGLGLLVALFVAHGYPPSGREGPYVYGAMYFVIGIISAISWHFHRHKLLPSWDRVTGTDTHPTRAPSDCCLS
jgi:FtsH-binding integral membrane protein